MRTGAKQATERREWVLFGEVKVCHRWILVSWAIPVWQRSWDTGGMFQVEIYAPVRRAVRIEGRSQRAVAGSWDVARDNTQDTRVRGAARLSSNQI